MYIIIFVLLFSPKKYIQTLTWHAEWDTHYVSSSQPTTHQQSIHSFIFIAAQKESKTNTNKRARKDRVTKKNKMKCESLRKNKNENMKKSEKKKRNDIKWNKSNKWIWLTWECDILNVKMNI